MICLFSFLFDASLRYGRPNAGIGMVRSEMADGLIIASLKLQASSLNSTPGHHVSSFRVTVILSPNLFPQSPNCHAKVTLILSTRGPS
jgi:hypothetical protein